MQSIYLTRDNLSFAKGEIMIITSSMTELYSNEGGKGQLLKCLMQGEEVSVLAKASGGYRKIKTTDDMVGYVKVSELYSPSESEENKDYSSVNSDNKDSDDYSRSEGNVSGIESGNESTAFDKNSGSASSINDNADSNSQLQTSLSKAQSIVGGNWAAALIVLGTGETTLVNDSQMQAASLIKLYIMGAVYEKYDTYLSAEPNLDIYLYNMITVSDNLAANHLVSVLGSGNSDAGKNVVNLYCMSYGFNYTSMGRLLLESTANGDNYTSVGDCAGFLAAVYNNQFPHSEDMVNLLKQQQLTLKIPAGVPVQTANKTGELESVQNDAAIVYANIPYVLCVMSENVPSGSAVSAITLLSSETYTAVGN